MHQTVNLNGVIDESFNFSAHFNSALKSYKINCASISRITSYGIKNWIEFFRGLRNSGKKLTFVDVSPSIVRQLAHVNGIIEPHEVVSVCIQYYCKKCQNESVKILNVKKIIADHFKIEQIQCEVCKSQMTFDDISDEYFSFLK